MVGGAEESDATLARKEERPELENLVVLGKGLRWSCAFSTDTGNEECRKQEAADLLVSNLQELGVTKYKDPELGLKGESLEVTRGAERESGPEQWRRLAALYDPLAAGRSFDDSRQILSSPKESTKIDDLSHAVHGWENFEQRHPERTAVQLHKDMRLGILLAMCPTDLEKELTAHFHLFPDYAQTRAHIVTVISSHTRGPLQ